ncbi:uncharacterized protein LOC116296388 [Actinia tenebrosa]|uniref:Uncharacterized protein LOC116296388 n=1 Tax=Actinia tenebrosa TaxID=6105 RepID=A0A6P8I5K7_ACTTE|nr:uncharacterized protein LOC116296388 [Actinia tenebrosa]
METMFYDEPTLLTTARKPPMGLDNSSLKLNLCADGKNLDIAARRDELGFGDLADFLTSPDIGISSPDLENLVWKEWSSTLKTPGSLPEQQHIKQEHCEDNGVTKEQEVFAFGFTEALKKLQETERQEIEINQEEMTGDSSECSDSGSQEDSCVEPENCDAKITFISYTFDSNERLPSFQEAFSKIIIKKSKESEICFQIKMEASEDVPLVEQETDDQNNEEDNKFQKWNTNCVEKDIWDRVETVDEGFCSREEMQVDLDQQSYLEVPGISNECRINQPLNWEHSNDFSIKNSNFFKEKSTVDQHLLDGFSTDHYNDENYIENMRSIGNIENIGNHNHVTL